MKAVWFLLSLCLFVGCKHKEVIPQVADSLPIVDLNTSYPEKKINLAEVAKSEYIPLIQFPPILLKDICWLMQVFHLNG